jgi:hypothetical protein
MTMKELYESLLGTKCVQGALTVQGFDESMYEELYYTLLEYLAPQIGDDYEFWYTNVSRRYHRYKARGRHTPDFYDPQYEKNVESQTIREQLATIKYYIQKRAYSRYPLKDVNEEGVI